MIDGAVHAFYSLARAELLEMVKEMISLREATTDKPLGSLAVNPLLTSEGLLGNASTLMKQLVLKYAGPSNLTRFTTFVPMSLATGWSFQGFDVENGRASMMVIPTLPDDARSVTFFAGFAPGKLLSALVFPPPKKKGSKVRVEDTAAAAPREPKGTVEPQASPARGGRTLVNKPIDWATLLRRV